MSDLGSLTSSEAGARDGGIVLAVPLGSCEQHGPHLPLATDALVAAALCARLCEQRGDVVVAPLVGVGASGEHAGFAGTLSVGTDALAAYLTELVRSARSWTRGVVFVSAHGGNRDALAAVERTARHDGDDVLVFAAAVRGGDAHAGRTETSLVLALAEDLVRHNELVVGVVTPLVELLAELRRSGVAAVSPTGVLGDPTDASADEGHAVLDALVDDLVHAVGAAFPVAA